MKPGDKLPTESELVRGFGVSRTVVREAISRMQAAGLVDTQHGVGTFVLATKAESSFYIASADIATAIATRYGVSQRTAERDVKTARSLSAKNDSLAL